MLNKRHGQAKVFNLTELQQLLTEGFECSRNLALFGITLYCATRISESRQLHFYHAFDGETVRDSIVFPKEITKNKQGTRVIPTHPALKKILQQYRQDSLALFELKNKVGHWSHYNLNSEGKLVINNWLRCPYCHLPTLTRQGRYYIYEEWRYRCKECGRYCKDSHLSEPPENTPATIEYDPLGVICSSNYGFLFADPHNPHLFPGKTGRGCLSLRTSLSIFEKTFKKLGIVGAGTHSCRRTSLTLLHRENVLLRVIQEISGHKSLDSLQSYLEVSEEQKQAAINVLA